MMNRKLVFLSGVLVAMVFLVPCRAVRAEPASSDPVAALQVEVARLRQQLDEQRALFEGQIGALEARLERMASRAEPSGAVPALGVPARVYPDRALGQADAGFGRGALERFGAGLQSMNPDFSAIVDTFYQADNADGGISHVLERIAGFGHVHPGGGHHHDHGIEQGFNLRHLELQVSAMVDPYFKGTAIAAVDLDGAEMEVAEIETLSLPYGLRLRAGKFFSDFGYINAKHAHEWDFVDRPLVHHLLLGDHGLNDKGLQLTWLAPTPFYLMAGVEAFQGENEVMFAHHGDAALPSHSGPRAWVGWLKFSPNLAGPNALQLGVFAGTGKHQEEHDALDNAAWTNLGIVNRTPDGEPDHWLDGDNRFWGADFVYKRSSGKPYGHGNLTLQGEYMRRRKALELIDHILPTAPIGGGLVEQQDGYYVQALYGLLPRWRVGLRWEQVGLTNSTRNPSGAGDSFGSSYRFGPMVDFTLSEFSRVRFQFNRGVYETDTGREAVNEGYVQLMISLGAHGAHNF